MPERRRGGIQRREAEKICETLKFKDYYDGKQKVTLSWRWIVWPISFLSVVSWRGQFFARAL